MPRTVLLPQRAALTEGRRQYQHLCALCLQVPAQVCNFEAERMLPPQVPPRHTDHLRYPDNLQAGFEQKYPDPYDPAPRLLHVAPLTRPASWYRCACLM